MSNDIKSQPQPAPAGNVAQVFRPEASDVSAPVAARPALNGVNVAQVFRPEAFAFPVPAAALELPTQIMSRLRKFAYPLLTKCKWSRPLLIDSALQTKFDLTYSKQTTEKFLTGARTHIKVFEFLSFITQNLAQLIQRHHHVTPRRLPALRLPNSSAIMICFKRGRLDSH